MNIKRLMVNKLFWAAIVLLLGIFAFAWEKFTDKENYLFPYWVVFIVPFYFLCLIICFVVRLIGILQENGIGADALKRKARAREWLVFIGTVVLGLALKLLGEHFRPLEWFYNLNPEPIYRPGPPLWLPYLEIIAAGELLMTAYPVYLFIRFVHWIIKRIKKG
jgi:hypothetical protein